MKVKMLSLVLVAVMVFLVGCGGPSVENERNKYNHYQGTLKKCSPKYPAFRSFMVKVSQSAHKLVEEGKKLEDEAAKAKKFQQANAVFADSKFYRQLSSMDLRMESVTSKKNLLRATYSRKYKRQITGAVNKAGNALKEARTIMANAKPASIEQAVEEIKKANSLLISAEGSLDRVKRQIKKKKKTKNPFKKKRKK
jgi:hypothetical protein